MYSVYNIFVGRKIVFRSRHYEICRFVKLSRYGMEGMEDYAEIDQLLRLLLLFFFSLSPPCAPLPSLRSTSEQMNLRIGYSRSFFVDAIDLIHYYCLLKSTNRDTYNMHFYLTSLIFTGTPPFLFFWTGGLSWLEQRVLRGTLSIRGIALFDKSLSPSFFHSSSTTTTLSDMSFFFFFSFPKRNKLWENKIL